MKWADTYTRIDAGTGRVKYLTDGDWPNNGGSKMDKHKFNVGDVVVLSRAFLQSTGQFTGDAPFDEGTIVHIDRMHPQLDDGIALFTVLWKLRGAGKVLNKNVILKSHRHLEPA
ncbi:MAG TPA: hypothetical protein VIV60_15280 [Polyangiaceae bacterium]